MLQDERYARFEMPWSPVALRSQRSPPADSRDEEIALRNSSLGPVQVQNRGSSLLLLHRSTSPPCPLPSSVRQGQLCSNCDGGNSSGFLPSDAAAQPGGGIERRLRIITGNRGVEFTYMYMYVFLHVPVDA